MTYVLRCIFPGDPIPDRVLMTAGGTLTVRRSDDGVVEELVYQHTFTEGCWIEFAEMEVKP